jgi:hypothetical protein
VTRTSVPDEEEAGEENYVIKSFIFFTHLQLFIKQFNDKG